MGFEIFTEHSFWDAIHLIITVGCIITIFHLALDRNNRIEKYERLKKKCRKSKDKEQEVKNG